VGRLRHLGLSARHSAEGANFGTILVVGDCLSWKSREGEEMKNPVLGVVLYLIQPASLSEFLCHDFTAFISLFLGNLLGDDKPSYCESTRRVGNVFMLDKDS
jgi:hypothetical protein